MGLAPFRVREQGPLRCKYPVLMEPHPAVDPNKLLKFWQEWETGETTPGRVMSNLKTAGMKELLEQLVADLAPSA